MIIISWILLAVAVIGFAMVILAKLPGVLHRPTIGGRVRIVTAAEGLWTYVSRKLRFALGKVWHFVLEAKDLKPTTLITHEVQKVKQVFKVRIRTSEKEALWMPEVAGLLEQAKNAKDWHAAEELYLNAIKNDPNNQQAYEGLGRLYLQEKNYREAAETFKFLTRLDPRKDTYWSNLGLALYSIQNYPEASISYEKALGINGKVPARWVNVSLCYDQLGDMPRVIKALNQAVQLDRRNVNYMMMLADAYRKVRNKVRAEEVLEQILGIDPTHKQAREKLMRLRI